MRNRTYVLILGLLFSMTGVVEAQTGWKLVYVHDHEGNVLQGNKEDLIEAARLGKELRVGWTMGGGGRSVEHFANVQFVSIIDDEVFGQISEINAQVPDFTEPSIDFVGQTIAWSFIASTTGKNATMMYNKTNPEKEFKNFQQWGNKWFVRSN